MTWLRNPFFAPPRTANSDDNNSDAEAALPELTQNPSVVDVRAPSQRLTGYQKFYIFGLDGIGAFVLSGGINFAIAYGMTPTQSPLQVGAWRY